MLLLTDADAFACQKPPQHGSHANGIRNRGQLMTKADQIRRLSAEGLSVSEIAAKVGVRYQHAYNVLRLNSPKTSPRVSKPPIQSKPPLYSQVLLDAGFRRACGWALDDAGLLCVTDALPKDVGVYAFAKHGIVNYVGVATMGLAKRIYFYARPGISQRTSLRLNDTIKREIQSGGEIDVLIAQPENMQWNGLPVHGAAGLELGLIKAFALPWNIRSAK